MANHIENLLEILDEIKEHGLSWDDRYDAVMDKARQASKGAGGRGPASKLEAEETAVVPEDVVRHIFTLAERWADARVDAIRKRAWGPEVRKAQDALWEFCRGLGKQASAAAPAPGSDPVPGGQVMMSMQPELELGWVRYEKARKLNPQQWADLHARNLAGENFDDMVDALPVPSTPRPEG
ncbi:MULTISPECIES: hypothetical protein [unclassified Variovorax]|uniref:hypothetical protein n=1 Tax=unclassified Variovorax TaxID=663243 RepID=UPI00076D7A9C|nr:MULTISPECIES: hypothetical protein [unclassified Variovorax]KWT95593.1 hypothetical protein APY03_2470 [Variovorax sp. WDL1]PNG50205.1 hypothetical protein CHC06_05828 [Variovorax sp. B2]PNG51078.1 hypothetical protein CHC07_05734 [Variovorax sp. B4]VTU42332.1 hypothetical protein SRS16P1_00243 [Variovorax sp. SRS16]VTU42358.1 hypothetical protein E5P1_00241 [Variovorax sp. PBL-E5]